jgi:hypothetical protein
MVFWKFSSPQITIIWSGNKSIGLEVLTAVTVNSTVFWDVMLCSLVEVYQHSSEISVNFHQTTVPHPEDSTLKKRVFRQFLPFSKSIVNMNMKEPTKEDTVIWHFDILCKRATLLFYITVLSNWSSDQGSQVHINRSPTSRAIAQAVSRWLPTAAVRGAKPDLGMWDLWWDKVALGRFSPSTSVSPAIVVRSTNYSTIALMYHPGKMYNRPMRGRSTGTYNNLGDLQRDLRGLSPTPPN